MPLRVIGVLAAKGQTAYGTDQDDLVMIPLRPPSARFLALLRQVQQQIPLNWVYLPPPIPIIFSSG